MRRLLVVVIMWLSASARSTSIVPVPPWPTLFSLSPDQVRQGLLRTPILLPTAQTLGPDFLSLLRSPHRKLSTTQLASRYTNLVNFWLSAYPSIPLAALYELGLPLYAQYISNTGLSDVPHFSLAEFTRHRALLLALNVLALPLTNAQLNHFAVLDAWETRWMTGLAPRSSGRERGFTAEELDPPLTAARQLATLPPSVDMRASPNMPPIRNQEECGSCWAFVATGAMELMQIFNNHGPSLGELSEQVVISCDKSNLGCQGGTPEAAWAWIKSQGGVTSSSHYPYANYPSVKTPTPKCNTTKELRSPKLLKVHGATVFLPSVAPTSSAQAHLNAEAAIAKSIANGVPVAIQLAASSTCFQTYRGPGPLTCDCGGVVDHVVLAVGYTSSYFILRNQWSTFWGVQGYAYMPRYSVFPVLGGQCAYLSGPTALTQVVEVAGATTTITGPPVSPPTLAPTHEGNSICPPASPLYCGASAKQPCCSYIDIGGGSLSPYVCCANGMCAQMQQGFLDQPSVVVCPPA
jgi:hypothetical protein